MLSCIILDTLELGLNSLKCVIVQHTYNKYLLSAYHEPGTILDARDSAVSKDKILIFGSAQQIGRSGQ